MPAIRLALVLAAAVTAATAGRPALSQAQPPFPLIERPVPPGADPTQVVPDHRLSKDAPSIYISFERTGAASDALATRFLETGDSRNSKRPGKDIWLRLHNNSLWAVSLTTLGMHTGKPPEMIELLSGNCVFAAADGMEVALVYQLRREDGREVPVYPGLEMFWTTWLPPGRSVLFSVPPSILPKKWVVAVRFGYEWKDGLAGFMRGVDPIHIVEFWHNRIDR